MNENNLILMEPIEVKKKEEKPNFFSDFFEARVNPGDFVMYPINTHIRFGVVERVLDYKNLRVYYALESRYIYDQNTAQFIILQDGDPRAVKDKKQNISSYQRSVIKIDIETINRAALTPGVRQNLIEKSIRIQSKMK